MSWSFDTLIVNTFGIAFGLLLLCIPLWPIIIYVAALLNR